MTSKQGRSPSDDGRRTVDLEPILEALGQSGRYQVSQLMLNIFASFLYTITLMEYVFIGYQPDYKCSEVDNITELETHLPDDVTNFSLHDVSYQQCSIDVTVNSSNVTSTYSLPCVWALVCDKAGLAELTQTAMFGGTMAGGLFLPPVDDRYGRKRVYIVCTLCLALVLIAMGLAPTYHMFLVCKIVSGFFLVGMVHSAYTMFMELLPQPWRYLGSFLDSMVWTLACLVMAALAYCLQGVCWRYLKLALCCPYVFSLVLPWFLDESLRWLVATGQIEQAENILKKACRMNGKDFQTIKTMLHKQFSSNTTTNNEDHDSTDATVDCEEQKNKKEISTTTENNSTDHDSTDSTSKCEEQKNKKEMMKEENHTETCLVLTKEGTTVRCVPRVSIFKDSKVEEEVFSAKYTILDLFRHRAVLVPFLVTIFVWMTSNLYFYAVILGSASLSGNRFLNFSLLNLQDIPSNLLALFLLRRFNRRPLAFTYHLIAGIFLLISVSLVGLGGEGVALTVATAAQYVGMFSLTGSYILLFVYYMEVYPTAMRAVGTGTSGMIIKLGDMGAPFLILWAERTPWAPGVLLGCLCCVASFTIWLLPETRHRKLPDTIEEIKSWKRKEVVC